jgi:hypothetical protein
VVLSRRGFAAALTVPLVAEEPNTHSVKNGLVFKAMCNVFEKSDISLSLGISQPEVRTSHSGFIKQQPK